MKTVEAIIERQAALNDAVRKGMGGKAAASLSKYVYSIRKGKLGYTSLDALDQSYGGIDEDNHSILFTVSTINEDRDGDVVEPMGVELKEYALNPCWFFGHQEWEIPIGTSRGPDNKLYVFKEENRLQARCFFDMADPDGAFLFGKVQRKILNATSIAFIPVEAYRREHEQKAVPRHEPNHQPLGWRFARVALSEISIVGVPANAEAVRHSLDHEKGFSPRMEKALNTYAAKGKVCWNGFCLPAERFKELAGAASCEPCEKSDPNDPWRVYVSQTNQRGAPTSYTVYVDDKPVARGVDSRKRAHEMAARKRQELGLPTVEDKSLQKTIRYEGSKWVLYSHDGGKVLGRHDSKEDAEAQERAVQANKYLVQQRGKSYHVVDAEFDLDMGGPYTEKQAQARVEYLKAKKRVVVWTYDDQVWEIAPPPGDRNLLRIRGGFKSREEAIAWAESRGYEVINKQGTNMAKKPMTKRLVKGTAKKLGASKYQVGNSVVWNGKPATVTAKNPDRDFTGDYWSYDLKLDDGRAYAIREAEITTKSLKKSPCPACKTGRACPKCRKAGKDKPAKSLNESSGRDGGYAVAEETKAEQMVPAREIKVGDTLAWLNEAVAKIRRESTGIIFTTSSGKDVGPFDFNEGVEINKSLKGKTMKTSLPDETKAEVCPECGGQLDDGGQCVCGYAKDLTDKGNPEETKAEPFAGEETPEEEALEQTEQEEGHETRSQPLHSQTVLANLHTHIKSAIDYLDSETQKMDHPQLKASLVDHRSDLEGLQQKYKDMLSEHHPDADMDELTKAIEGGETYPTPEPGEAGKVQEGEVPDEDISPEEDMIDKDEVDLENDNHPATDEILERYQKPAKGGSKSMKIKDLTDEGNPSELDPGDGGGTPSMLNPIKEAATHMESMMDDDGVPKYHHAGLSHHSKELHRVHKEFSEDQPFIAKMFGLNMDVGNQEVPQPGQAVPPELKDLTDRGNPDEIEAGDASALEPLKGMSSSGIDPNTAGNLQVVKDAAEYMDHLMTDAGMPGYHKAGLTHHSKALHQVHKDLSDIGNPQEVQPGEQEPSDLSLQKNGNGSRLVKKSVKDDWESLKKLVFQNTGMKIGT